MPDYKLVTILTIRSASERLPGKALKTVAHRPLVNWLIDRLRQLPGELCLATTDDPSDDTLSNIAIRQGIPVWRESGPTDDVVSRMDNVINHLYPDADFVFRALGDCPFIEPQIVKRACDVMHWRKTEAFLWYLPPGYWPFYGAREFPYARTAWNRIARYARHRRGEREHIDAYFNNTRREFRISYHQPPPSVFFPINRPPYRLEIDHTEDLALVRKIANKGPGMLAPMKEIIEWLDDNHPIATINLHLTEKTGPSISHTSSQYREWWGLMRNQPIITWRNKIWTTPDKRASRIFCTANSCLIGWGLNGLLYTTDDSIIKEGFVNCKCGAGRNWERKL